MRATGFSCPGPRELPFISPRILGLLPDEVGGGAADDRLIVNDVLWIVRSRALGATCLGGSANGFRFAQRFLPCSTRGDWSRLLEELGACGGRAGNVGQALG